MENPTNLKDSLFIQLGYEEGMPDTLCEVCAKDGIITEADSAGSDYGFDGDLCSDCFSEVYEWAC